MYTPGPTMVPPSVLKAMSRQIINPDLDPDFPAWFLETAQKTGEIIKTKQEVLLLPGEGMLALDAALNSVVKPGDKVLVLASGIFGHGFGGLGDEYYTSDVAYEDFYNLEVEPWEPNLTTLVNFDSKWKKIITDSTPVPTPRESKYEKICVAGSSCPA